MILTANETYSLIKADSACWSIYLMDFVDDFRRERCSSLVHDKITFDKDCRFAAILAATVDYLCHELEMGTPMWCSTVAPLSKPWFVSGIEAIKAITIVESPAEFKARNIFVLENFLDRA